MMELPQEVESPNFEPQARSRSYTWHGAHGAQHPTDEDPELLNAHELVEGAKDDVFEKEPLNLKKPATRRNAWGCMSYADLISRAIESVPEQRLTLAQIYEWMTTNIPYFRDKGESNSSAGWKNSIRHNLSLHRRFSRLQNEGTGKSSWWIVNVEAKASKAPRRRAATMDAKTFEKKRTRVRRKVESNAVSGSIETQNETYGNHHRQESYNNFNGGRMERTHSVGVLHQNMQIPSIDEEDRYEMDSGMMMGNAYAWNHSREDNLDRYSASAAGNEVFSDAFCGVGMSGMYGSLTPAECGLGDEQLACRVGVADFDSSYVMTNNNVPGTRMTTLQNLSEHFLDCSPTGGVAATTVNGSRSYRESSPPMVLPSPPPYMTAAAEEFSLKGMPPLSHYPVVNPTAATNRSGGYENGSICGSGAYMNGMKTEGGTDYELMHEYYGHGGGALSNSADVCYDYSRNNLVGSRYVKCDPEFPSLRLNSPNLSSTSVLRQMLAQSPPSGSANHRVSPMYAAAGLQSDGQQQISTNHVVKLEQPNPNHDLIAEDAAVNFSVGSPGARANYGDGSPGNLNAIPYCGGVGSPNDVNERCDFSSGRRMLNQGDVNLDNGSDMLYLNNAQQQHPSDAAVCSSIEMNRMVDSICGARLDDSYEDFNELGKHEAAYVGGGGGGNGEEEELWEFNMDMFPTKCAENT